MQKYFIFGLIAIVAGVSIFLWQSQNTQMPNETAQKNVDMLSHESGEEVRIEEVVYFENTKGIYTEPVKQGNYPGVIMIHEWWGLNDNIKNMAKELAKDGYRVLAVDLFGKVAQTQDEARVQTAALNKDKAVQNLKAATAFIRAKGATKIASLGWCFGGGQSLQLALSGEILDATVIYYGSLVTDRIELQKISWPVLGIFGDKDASIPVTTIEKFGAVLKDVGVENDIHIYPGVGHAFANPSGMNYAPEETKDAWTKTVAFLAKNLKLAEPSATPPTNTTQVKEFTMTAYFDPIAKKPLFSINEILVKKGDLVRINITNTMGMHDITIDEFNVRQELMLNKQEVIEFVADKAGTFTYYCSKPGHRQNGQLGTLRVE